MADFIDTSMYGHQPNPLEQAGQVARTVNEFNQNRLFQARRAVGQAAQESLDPATGQLDHNKFMGLVGANPKAAVQALEAMQQDQQLQQNQLNIHQQKMQNLKTGADILSGNLSGMVAGGDFSDKALGHLAADLMGNKDLMSSGLISNTQIIDKLVNAPPEGPAREKYMRNLLATMQGVSGHIDRVLPPPSAFNVGGSTVLASPSSVTGNMNMLGALQNTLSPSEKTSGVPTVGKNESGQDVPGMVPKGVLFSPTGDLAMPPGASAFPGATGNAGDSAHNLPAGAPPVNSSSLNPPGFVQTGFPLGREAASTVVAQQSGQDLGNDRQSAKNSAGTLYNMTNAMEALKKAPTGAGTETTNALKNFAIAFDPTGALKNTDWGEGQAAYDKANKYLTAQAQQLAESVGPHTDSNLATALSGSPNTHINNLAAQDVQKALIGLKRLDFARTRAFDDSSINSDQAPDNYQKWGAKFNDMIDPRGFMADQMSKSQLKATLKGMSKLEREKFNNAYDLGVKYGLMNEVGAPSGQ